MSHYVIIITIMKIRIKIVIVIIVGIVIILVVTIMMIIVLSCSILYYNIILSLTPPLPPPLTLSLTPIAGPLSYNTYKTCKIARTPFKNRQYPEKNETKPLIKRNYNYKPGLAECQQPTQKKNKQT